MISLETGAKPRDPASRKAPARCGDLAIAAADMSLSATTNTPDQEMSSEAIARGNEPTSTWRGRTAAGMSGRRGSGRFPNLSLCLMEIIGKEVHLPLVQVERAKQRLLLRPRLRSPH